jgi:hypothetical protein
MTATTEVTLEWVKREERKLLAAGMIRIADKGSKSMLHDIMQHIPSEMDSDKWKNVLKNIVFVLMFAAMSEKANLGEEVEALEANELKLDDISIPADIKGAIKRLGGECL